MPFDYYHRLSRNDQKIYRQSDALPDLPDALRQVVRRHDWADGVAHLRSCLEAGQRLATEKAARQLLDQFAVLLATPPVRVQVRAVRPSEGWGELHGLYTPAEGKAWGLIEVWMRTARHRRVVAFRTFLRTLLHELCHHLDYELYHLEDSFHTEGFFQRESRLFRHLGLDKGRENEGREKTSTEPTPDESEPNQPWLPGVRL